LAKKHDPAGAVLGAADWLVTQRMQSRTPLEESSRGMEAWERVMGKFEEKAALMEVGRPGAGSLVFGSRPADIVDVLAG
jgi:hypothetical protein